MTRILVYLLTGQTFVVGVSVPEAWRPSPPKAGTPWSVGVLPGPQAAPDYFTTEDVETVGINGPIALPDMLHLFLHFVRRGLFCYSNPSYHAHTPIVIRDCSSSTRCLRFTTTVTDLGFG